MKANELMINDWVLVHKTPQQVAVIEETCISYWAELPMSTELLSPSLSGIEPIPLTPEILEKNGWKHYATYGSAEDETLEEIYMLYQHSFEVVFDSKKAISIRHFVSEEDDGYDKLLIEYRDNGYKPMYVHTLQHAMRLCGLTELADHFKL